MAELENGTTSWATVPDAASTDWIDRPEPDDVQGVPLPGTDGVTVLPVPGAPGLTGDQGEQGEPGLSAYEVAVLNGFSGTQEEWLSSLNGELSPEAIAEIRNDLDNRVSTALGGINDDIAAVFNAARADLNDHIVAAEPHTAYDDLPSLTLIFENGMA